MKTTFSIAAYCFILWLKFIGISFGCIVLSSFFLENWGMEMVIGGTLATAFISFFPLLTFSFLTYIYQHYFPYQNKAHLKKQLRILGFVSCTVFNLLFWLIIWVSKIGNNINFPMNFTIGISFASFMIARILIFMENRWGGYLKEAEDYPSSKETEELIETIGQEDK